MFQLVFSIQTLLFCTTIFILSPALSFIPSLMGFGKAKPTELPHLTSVPSNSTDINESIICLYVYTCLDVSIMRYLDSDIDKFIYRLNLSLDMSKILQNSNEHQKTTGKSDPLQNDQQHSEWKTIGVKV